MLPRMTPTVVRFSIAMLTIVALTVPTLAQSGSGQSRSRTNPSYLFQVALLVADREGTSSLEDLPKNTRKAIEDIRDFLPFSSYRLVDVSVIRSNAHGRGLINGPDNEDYQVDFDFHMDRESDQLIVRSFALVEKVSVPAAVEREKGEAYAPVSPWNRNLVASSFSILPGETIVVGSSKLDGGTSAIVVLLTAIP